MGKGVSFVGDSVLFKNIIINKRVKDLINIGYEYGYSSWSKSVIVSNVLNPSKNTTVFSTESRHNFEEIDIKENFVDLFNEVSDIEISKNDIKDTISIDDLYSNLVIPKKEEYTFSSKVNEVIMFLNSMDLEDFISINKKIHTLKMWDKIFSTILNGCGFTLSPLLEDIIKTKEVKKNLMKISSILLNSDDINEFRMGVVAIL